MSRKVSIKKSKQSNGNTYDISFVGLTAGEIMSIKHALEASGSPVAQDVLAYLKNGLIQCNESWLKDMLL